MSTAFTLALLATIGFFCAGWWGGGLLALVVLILVARNEA